MEDKKLPFPPSKKDVETLRAKYPCDTRLMVDKMDDPNPVPTGTTGTVDCVDDAGQIQMHWDNGQTLALVPGIDNYHKI